LRVKFVITGALALAALTACSHSNVDSLDAVKNVVSVSFRDKEADAVVSFAPKGGTAAQGLTMNYTMERAGSEWHIKKRAQSDLQRHAAQANPGGMGAGSLPEGHVPLTDGGGSGSGQRLPPGHPPLKQ
jgi:hypothetical protein